jgi:uncharacterized membrane protein
MSGRLNPGSGLFSRQLDDDFARLWRILMAHPECVVLGLGVLLRLVVYLSGRSFWMDESSLWGNLAHKPILDFSEPMTGDQLAPLGFLIVQRALMSILGVSRYAARLLPLLCGVGSIFMFARVAHRILAHRPALIAIALFCFSDDLIYYSSELKPYSLDLAIGLAVTLAALDSLGEPVSGRGAAKMAVLAIAAPWFSFPAVFIVAGCGAVLMFTKSLRDVMVWIAVGIGCAVNFFISYRVSQTLLSPYTTMYRFWHFAFLPIWPLPMGRARFDSAVGILLETFVTPLNLVAPVWPWAGVVLPLLLLLLGAWSLARRSWGAWAMLVLPIILAMVASAIGRYPFHGRLILELVPAFFVLIAEGAETVRGWEKSRVKPGFILVLILLFAYPCLAALMNVASVRERDFNPHGDIRRNLFIP